MPNADGSRERFQNRIECFLQAPFAEMVRRTRKWLESDWMFLCAAQELANPSPGAGKYAADRELVDTTPGAGEGPLQVAEHLWYALDFAEWAKKLPKLSDPRNAAVGRIVSLTNKQRTLRAADPARAIGLSARLLLHDCPRRFSERV